MGYFKGKVTLITGGASGLGAALAEALHAAGAVVLILDNDDSGLKRFITLHRDIAGYFLDVTDPDSIRNAIEDIVKSHGKIDILVNNAGVFVTGEARDFSTLHWKKCFDVNLMGMVNMISMIYPRMARQRSGQIVNIASMVGLAPLPLIIPYVASKYGIVGLTKSLRIEAKSLGIKINLVCPGRLDTDLLDKSEIVNSDRDAFLAYLPFRPYSLRKAVNRILGGIIKNRSMIIFPGYVYLLWYAERFSNRLLFPIYSMTMKRFRKIRL